jgi:hypothetical protein
MKARFDVGEMPDWGACSTTYRISRRASCHGPKRIGCCPRSAPTWLTLARWRCGQAGGSARFIKLKWADVDFANAEALTRIKGGAVVRRALTNDMIWR